MTKQQIIKIIKENTISVQQLQEMKEHGYHRVEWYIIDGKNDLIPMMKGEDMEYNEYRLHVGHIRLDLTAERLYDMDYDTIEEYWMNRIEYIIQSCATDEEIDIDINYYINKLKE